MKFSLYSPAIASILCSSSPVPKVVITSAWVSPLVKRADPWVRSRIPVSHTIGLTVFVFLPSILFPDFSNSLLTISFSIDLTASAITTEDKVSDEYLSSISSLNKLSFSDLSCFSWIL